MNEELLEEYSSSIKNLRKQCLDQGMSEEEFRRLYFEILDSVQKINQNRSPKKWKTVVKLIILLFAFVLLLIIIYNFKSIYSTLICHLQEYIYPGLKLLRQISIPFISLFPGLTDLYHETCLLQNPFFTVVDMDCWPCSSVTNVREIYDPELITNQQHTVPFIYKTDQNTVNFEALQKLYSKNEHIFNKESPKILLNNKYYLNANEVFKKQHNILQGESLLIWKFNTMNIARVIRQVIPRPKVVPKFGQSTERFIIVDSRHESFQIPDTECSFSFLLFLSGIRTVKLKPAEECKHQCRSLEVELRESHLLWYNWWYWRPIVLPSTDNNTLIAHVGSYC